MLAMPLLRVDIPESLGIALDQEIACLRADESAMETLVDRRDDRSRESVRRNRLLFKSWHRGTHESDLLLGSFADSCLAGLDTSQLRRFEVLLECSDPDLFEWILGGGVPPAEHDHDVLHLLCAYWAQRQNKPLGQARTAITSGGE
jgi:antitoxin CptB